MPRFGDEIAVLDGLNLGEENMMNMDGRIGRRPATGSEYAKFSAHNVASRQNVLDPSEGATYGGGSNYAPGMPLMPSSVGLADTDLLRYSEVTNVLPPATGVVNPSFGANYSGGSNYTPGIPLMTSSDPGLARMDRYADFAGVPLAALDAFFGSSIEIEDGRIGRRPATGAEYAKFLTPQVASRQNVLDPSEGATYGGGSNYAPGLPLMPSSVGLAALGAVDGLDQVPDSAFMPRLTPVLQRAFTRAGSKQRLQALKGKAAKIQKAYTSMNPQQRMQARQKLSRIGEILNRVRGIRRGIARRPVQA